MAKINTLNYQTVASWNGSQDLFVVEQPDGTKVATPAMVKQYVLGNSIDDVYSVMGQNGAKNLIPYPYYSESGYSNQGMTITYDADGVFTINKVAGTATAYYRIATLNFLKPSTKYRLVFEVENATSISIFLQKPTTGDYVTINNKSSGIFVAEFETTADSQISSKAIGLSCTASDTETNATVKVMLVYASDTDNTYQPYAKTNRQLTEEIGDLSQTGLTGNSVAGQLGSALGLLNGKANNVNLGEVNASTDIEALGAAWDTLNIYDKTVVAHFARFGKFEALMYKCGGSQYGMVIAMKYGSTDIYVLSVRSGTKYYATYSSESGTVTSTLFDTNRIAVTSQDIKYRKSGNIVTVYGDVTFGAKVTTSGNYISADRLPFISSIQSIVSGKIVCDTGTTTPYEAVSKGGTNSIWFSYNGTNEMQTTYFENKKFHLYLTYVVS